MYYLALFLQKILLRLPLSVCFTLGRLIGLFLYLNGKKRSIAFRNLKSIFPCKSNAAIRHICRQSFTHLGLGIVEAFINTRIFPFIEARGLENISPEGGVFAAIHEGSWELYNTYLAQKLHYAVFARQQKNKGLDRFLNRIRNDSGLGVFLSLKGVVKYLHQNYIVGMVIDHGAEEDALVVEFFSHLVPTPKGAVVLAKKFNKKIYPCFGYRKDGFFHILEIGKGLEPDDRDEAGLLRYLNGIFEEKLNTHPSEYLWQHKRFKRKRDRDVLILSDGKVGHLKQSQALASLFKEEAYSIRSKIIEIKYRHRLQRIFSEVCALATTRFCLGCGACLRFLVDGDTLHKLMSNYADIVISTGSFVAPFNRIMAKVLGAKSVTILRPNIPLKKFDVSIIPAHDRIQAENAVTIKGALFYPLNLEEKMKKCKDFFHLSEAAKVSFFVGGYLSYKKEFMENLKLFIEKLKGFSIAKNYKVIVSTSRRTPPEVEKCLRRGLEHFRNTEVIVYARSSNLDFVFEGFVSLSEMVFVSSESISMISEVSSLKKLCVCVFLERHLDKHRIFLQSIEGEVTFLKNPYNIQEIEPKASYVFEHNRTLVKEAIKRLL